MAQAVFDSRHTHAFFRESLPVLEGYQPVAPGCMSAVVTPLTKLIVIGHGQFKIGRQYTCAAFCTAYD